MTFIRMSLAALFCLNLFADQVDMKNGDRLSGVITHMDGKVLTLKSEYAGSVNLPWDAVVGLTSSTTLHIGLHDGQILVGAVKASDSQIEIQTKQTGAVSASRNSVKFIRSQEEQATYETEIERYRNPRLLDLWTGFVDLGFAQTRGNADIKSINVSANAVRDTKRDKISTYFTSLYASSGNVGASLATANAIRGGVAYNLNISPKLFAFISTDLEFDEFQRLDLRFAPAAGLGYHAIKTDRTTLDLLGGVSLNREFFSTGLRRTSGEVLAGEEFVHKMSAATSIHEKFVIYPNVSDLGSFRMNFDTAAVTTLRKWFAWQFTISDRYLSNPVPGRRKNDVLLTTGVRVTFAK
ncbi:MAG TPA: DUF481 domain-containing protein [Bryobacteraceae bacterium]|nr:DUF481 domain-containing protein [Bryobacteraceae bacterium]